MNDDFRVRVELPGSAEAQRVADHLERGEVEHDIVDRVIVSVDGAEMFLYAGTRQDAERARRALESLAGRLGLRVRSDVMRWHPTAEAWEDADVSLPASDEDRAREHAERVERERIESRRLGAPEYEVRVECASHHDVAQLADRLEADGLAPVRRWRFLLVGASDEDAAAELARRLADEVPDGSSVTVEGSARGIEAETPSNPFAVFGGLIG